MMKTIIFFNNKGGVGKTSLVYHLAWMYHELGFTVLAADMDPQANLTSMFVDEEELEVFWPDTHEHLTVFGALQPLLSGAGDIKEPYVHKIDSHLYLLPGDLSLSVAESYFNGNWPLCLDRSEKAFRVISSLWRVLELAVSKTAAQIVLIDVGTSLGAINRTAMISAQHVVIPLSPDIYSLQGLKNLGPTLRKWREEWKDRIQRNPLSSLSIPPAEFQPLGYIVLQHVMRLDHPVKAYDRWIARIPELYRVEVLNESFTGSLVNDPNCLATLKHFRSLMPLAQEAHKPMFLLQAADGAIGAHATAVINCYNDFEKLAKKIAEKCGITN